MYIITTIKQTHYFSMSNNTTRDFLPFLLPILVPRISLILAHTNLSYYRPDVIQICYI